VALVSAVATSPAAHSNSSISGVPGLSSVVGIPAVVGISAVVSFLLTHPMHKFHPSIL
jgi:hypothetical protein